MPKIRPLALLVLLLGQTAAGLAQDAAQPGQPAQPPANPLDLLRDKDVLSDEERNALRTWIEQRVAALQTAADAEAAERAVRELRDNRTGSNRFKELFAEMCIEKIRGAFAAAELAPASRMLAVLSALNEANTYTVLLDGLKDERAAVRTAAAVGLRNLRVKLSLAGGPYFTDTVAGLREAGKKETASVALKSIYHALNFPEVVPNPHDPKLNAAAILDLLEARAQRYQGASDADAADAVGLVAGGALRQFMGDPEKERLTTAAATMLRHAVLRYTGGETPLHQVQDKSGNAYAIAVRNATELVIEEAEKLLSEIVGAGKPPSPTITDAMKKAANPIDMKLAMNKWAKLLKEITKQDFELTESEGG